MSEKSSRKRASSKKKPDIHFWIFRLGHSIAINKDPGRGNSKQYYDLFLKISWYVFIFKGGCHQLHGVCLLLWRVGQEYAQFIHNLRTGKLPGEFKNFVTMVDFNDQDVRQSRFSPFNYHQIRDRTNPRYHIVNSWNNLPFLLKASQPDDFLEDLRDHFNKCNDQPCSIENCWLCDEK